MQLDQVDPGLDGAAGGRREGVHDAPDLLNGEGVRGIQHWKRLSGGADSLPAALSLRHGALREE